MPDIGQTPIPLDGLIATLELLATQARAYERALPPDNYPARAAVAALGELAQQALNEARNLAESLDAPHKIIVDRQGQLVPSAVKFANHDELRQCIDQILALGGITLGSERTSGHLRFPDGSRLLAVIPPTAITGPYLVLRKVRTIPFDMLQLLQWGSVTQGEYQLLQSAIQARLNILIGGGTGSGKTTFANVLADEFPLDERIIVIESVYELKSPTNRFVHLSADNSPDHSLSDLIDLASKMRPDRLMIAELTGPEAMKALDIFNRGHDGSLATLHASSPEDALTRLETMCLMANLGLGLVEIRAVIASAIQLITHQERLPDGTRKLTHIVELCGLENGRYQLKPIFRYNPASRVIEPTGAQPGWL